MKTEKIWGRNANCSATIGWLTGNGAGSACGMSSRPLANQLRPSGLCHPAQAEPVAKQEPPMNRWTSALMTLGMGLVLGLTASAQPQPGQGNQPGQPGGNNNRGNRGNFDPAAMRQRYLDSIKQDLGASDDEWKALEPRVQKVLDASRAARGSRGGTTGRTRGGNNGGDQASQQQPRPEDTSAVTKAAAEL